ncbi:T cell receptor beta constant 2 [Gavia stellata]|uniref:T cell receptor beta constant 2 n=1 Tax=Gavia stellata TaxID=37040 RepID=UPI00289C31B1|nr:T cell receptor beta constant 2 [Gavia stellata]
MVLRWFLVAILAPVGQALQQSPDTVVRVGDSVTLNCSQEGNAFSNMYWYKLPMGKDATLQLVVHSVEGGKADIEKEFRNHFQSNGTKDYCLSVKIDHALLNDSGTYFCAEKDPQLYFGSGTKLTVLGKNDEIIPPAVAIFSPSKQEIQQKSKATLVCLASDFYPDHLNLVWKVNGAKRTEGVGTDEFSTWNGSTYSLTSRLRISAQEWFNPLNRFECVANFFKNGTLESMHKLIYGDGGCALTEENYQRSATAEKFVYIMLIFKSILYGMFVMGLMLRSKERNRVLVYIHLS